MIVVSNSLPKSGSTLLCYLTADLVRAAYPQTGLDALARATAAGQTAGRDIFVRALDRATLRLLVEIADRHGPVVVKVHQPLTRVVRNFFETGRFRATLVHRDPRDVILSAMDHCRRTDGERFAEFHSVRTSIPQMRRYFRNVERWLDRPDTLVVRYTQLVTDAVTTLARVRDFLGIDVPEPRLRDIVSRRTENPKPGALQFNTGKITRFADEMDVDDIRLCNKKLGGMIERLGYDLVASQDDRPV